MEPGETIKKLINRDGSKTGGFISKPFPIKRSKYTG